MESRIRCKRKPYNSLKGLFRLQGMGVKRAYTNEQLFQLHNAAANRKRLVFTPLSK